MIGQVYRTPNYNKQILHWKVWFNMWTRIVTTDAGTTNIHEGCAKTTLIYIESHWKNNNLRGMGVGGGPKNNTNPPEQNLVDDIPNLQ